MEYIVVNDLKSEDMQRGASLTLEAYLESCPDSYTYVRSHELKEFMIKPETDFLILGNTTRLDPNLAQWIINKCHYVKINFDYNYCVIRNPHIHNLAYGGNVTYNGELGEYLRRSECHCDMSIGNIQADLIKNAEMNFFMSHEQKNEFKKVFPKLKSYVSHSCFDSQSLNSFLNLDVYKKNEKALIWNSMDYIKGVQNAIEYCNSNSIEYTLVNDIRHEEMLEKMAEHKYVVFMPNAWDTAPRLTIEAKMLGCKVITNNHVQHARETWWGFGIEETHIFLKDLPTKFWNKIEEINCYEND